jgi:hypothetical protein
LYSLRVIGLMQYENNDKYNGEWKEDKKQGQGVCQYADGDKYEGGWEDNKRSGEGISLAEVCRHP